MTQPPCPCVRVHSHTWEEQARTRKARSSAGEGATLTAFQSHSTTSRSSEIGSRRSSRFFSHSSPWSTVRKGKRERRRLSLERRGTWKQKKQLYFEAVFLLQVFSYQVWPLLLHECVAERESGNPPQELPQVLENRPQHVVKKVAVKRRLLEYCKSMSYFFL